MTSATGSVRLVVLDSSVGVKWFRREDGRDAALALLRDHGESRIRIVVASHFVTEIVAVTVRHGGAQLGRDAWAALRLAELTVVGLDDALAEESLRAVDEFGCVFYDALPVGLSRLLGAQLYSSDARAHSRVPGVVMI